MKEYIKVIKDRAVNKIRDNTGGAYIAGAFVIMGLVFILAFFAEYYRVYNQIAVADRAYEKAMLSVAIENYDEIFLSTRESTQIGGVMDGGNAGLELNDAKKKEKPVFVNMNDGGDIALELQGLLNTTLEENGHLLAYNDSGNLMYSLSDFKMSIKESTGYGGFVKYEVKGSFHIEVPFYLMGVEASRIVLDVPSVTAWKSRL